MPVIRRYRGRPLHYFRWYRLDGRLSRVPYAVRRARARNFLRATMINRFRNRRFRQNYYSLMNRRHAGAA